MQARRQRENREVNSSAKSLSAKAETGRYLLYRSGNWNNGSNDGAFTFNVNNGASNSNSNIGLRLANNNATARSQDSQAILSRAVLFGDIRPSKGMENMHQEAHLYTMRYAFIFFEWKGAQR